MARSPWYGLLLILLTNPYCSLTITQQIKCFVAEE